MPDFVLAVAPAEPYVLNLGEDTPDLDLIEMQGTTPYGRPLLNRENEAAAREYLGIVGYPPFRQSSKPTTRRDGSPLVIDDLWYATIDHAWFYWSGSYWLSCQLFSAFTSTGGSASLSLGCVAAVAPQIFLENMLFSALFSGPQNTVDFWRITLERQTLNSSVASTVAFNDVNYYSQSTGDNQHKNVVIALGIHQDLTALNCAGYRFGIYKNSAAGTLGGAVISLRYRIAK